MAIELIDRGVRTMITEGDILKPYLEKLNFREIGVMLRNINHSHRRSNNRFMGLNVDFRCDDEVIWDYWTVGRIGKSEHSPIWQVSVRYAEFSMIENQLIEPDYRRTQSKDRSTAYKYVRSDPSIERNFWIDAGWIEGDRNKILQELSDLSEFSLRTIEAQKSAEKWVSYGFDVRIYCKAGCNSVREPKVLPHEVFKSFISKGKDIEQFRSALVCKACGRRSPTIMPYEA